MLDRSLYKKLSISYKDQFINVVQPLTSCQQSHALFDSWVSNINNFEKSLTIPSNYSSDSVDIFVNYINNNIIPNEIDEKIRSELLSLSLFTITPELITKCITSMSELVRVYNELIVKEESADFLESLIGKFIICGDFEGICDFDFSVIFRSFSEAIRISSSTKSDSDSVRMSPSGIISFFSHLFSHSKFDSSLCDLIDFSTFSLTEIDTLSKLLGDLCPQIVHRYQEMKRTVEEKESQIEQIQKKREEENEQKDKQIEQQKRENEQKDKQIEQQKRENELLKSNDYKSVTLEQLKLELERRTPIEAAFDPNGNTAIFAKYAERSGKKFSQTGIAYVTASLFSFQSYLRWK